MDRFVIKRQLIINEKEELNYASLKGINGICLDMDGTIADSMGVLFRAYMQFLSEFSVIGSRKQFDSLAHLSINDVVTFLHEKYYLDSSLITLYEKYTNYVRQSYTLGIPLMVGAHVFIDFVKAKQLKLALVTTAKESIAVQFLQTHNLLSEFNAVVTPSFNLRGKPSPDMYLEALKRLEISAEEAIAVEDADVGLSASTQAGILSWKYSEPTDWEKLMKIIEQVNAKTSLD